MRTRGLLLVGLATFLVAVPTFSFAAGAYHRPLSDFLSTQGAPQDVDGDGIYGEDPDDYYVTDPLGILPSVNNFMGWIALVDNGACSIDYLGYANEWIEAVSGGTMSLGTTITGDVLERPLADGRAEVQVTLYTRHALAWAFYWDNDGTDNFGTDPLTFGSRPYEVYRDGAAPAFGDSFLQVRFINTAPMADLPTLEALSWWPAPGQELLFLGVRATADGVLADGTPGRLTVVQTAISGHAVLPGKDGWPAERVIVQPVGH